ncbi:hypothetical protein C8R46DRAFT_1104841 [Mycena filopes]|nr:hypothetical protein C8R46DRAFT_1104841 [Mycena filopes]
MPDSDPEKQTQADGSGEPTPEDEASWAKIWSVYISEAKSYDKALVDRWKEDMAGLLIFAGLFSGVLTAFIIESYKTLSPDSGEDTLAVLKQISSQLAASSSGSTFSVPTATPFVVPVTAVVCNVLWFLSLGLSLACALIATLVQQWARNFIQTAEMRPSPVIQARVYSYLYYGLKRFNMHLVVEVVPLLLHMSLVLFLAGLVAFLQPIHPAVVKVSATLLGVIVILYLILSILPVIYSDCPYQTPFSPGLWRINQLCRWVIARAIGGKSRLDVKIDETMVESMINRAKEPSDKRDNRDLRSLTWTTMSLTDGRELEGFMNGIPDVLWGPKGKRVNNQHLIRRLVDDEDARLGHRLLGLMQYGNSGVLDPTAEVRYKTVCLKALWTICTISEKETPLKLPFAALGGQLDHWMYGTSDNAIAHQLSGFYPSL